MEINQIYEQLLPGRLRVFFASKGLTSTEASYKANLIKERVQTINAKLNGTAAFHSNLDFEGQQIPLDNNVFVSDLEGTLLLQGEYDALTAWLREAIKAKDEALKLVKSPGVYHLLLDGEEILEFKEQRPQQLLPIKLQVVTENDIIDEFTVAERAEYFGLEAKASALGKQIHPDKPISNMRKQLQKGKLTGFMDKHSGVGLKTYVVRHTKLYDTDTIETMFFALQDKYRSYEERLNYYKAKIKNEVTSRNAEQESDYAAELRLSTEEYQPLLDAYNKANYKWITDRNAQLADIEQRRLNLVTYVSQLKIVVPKEYEDLISKLEDKQKA